MEDAANHSSCALHRQSPPAQSAADAHMVVLRVSRSVTAALTASRPHQAHPPAAYLPAARLLSALVQVAALSVPACAPAGDSDSSVPRLDASVSTTTSVTPALHCAQPP